MNLRRLVKSVFGWFGISALLLMVSFAGGIQADTQAQSGPNTTLLSLGSLAVVASIIGLMILFVVVWRTHKGGKA